MVDRHRADINALIDAGEIDILFANEAEALALSGCAGFDAAVAAIAARVPTAVITRSEQGAIAVSGEHRAHVAAEPIRQLVDTTGAGDLFAAGFLAGEARGLGLDASLRLGAIAAAEVIQHYGARPEADLKALAGDCSHRKRAARRRTARYSSFDWPDDRLAVGRAVDPRGIWAGLADLALVTRPLASSELCIRRRSREQPARPRTRRRRSARRGTVMISRTGADDAERPETTG